jgi:hypothetical protein
MKGLSTLIRIANVQVEEIRKEILAQEAQREAIQKEETELALLIAREEAEAARDPAFAVGFGAFLATVRVKSDALERRRAAIETLLDEMRERLSEAFLEVKRLELVMERVDAREAAEERAAEQAALDESNVLRHGRF